MQPDHLQKKSLFCKVIVLLFFMQTSVLVSGQNIVDYYYSLPESFFSDKDLGNIKYSLSKKGDAWFSESLAEYEFAALVDIKNGFIEFNDEGTGGGNVLIRVVLFRKADRSPLIGITKGGFNGFYFESSTAFYKKCNKTWVEANDVFPAIYFERFLNKHYREFYFDKDKIIAPNLSWLTELPQFGTTVNLILNFNKYDFLIESNHNPHKQKPFTEKEQTKLWEIIENISIESFQLKFNKRSGQFEVTDSVFLKLADKETLEGDSGSAIIPDEAFILDRLWNLKLVNELATYIDSASNQKRDLKLVFESDIPDKPNFVLVRAIEDNGGNLVTHLIFNVKKDGSEVYLYDAVEDRQVKIDQ